MPGPAGPMRVRRYAPAAPGRAAEAAILFMHGGGCVIGDVETHDVFCRTLCHDTGATVFSLDYRLAPEHPFPAAVEDTVAALTWLSHEAASLGLDPAADRDRRRQRGRRPRRRRPARDQRRARRAGAGPSLDLSRARSARTASLAHGTRAALPHSARHDPLVLRSLFRASPGRSPTRARSPRSTRTIRGLPPALIITAGHDPLRDEGAEYAQTLAAAGVPVEYECREGTIHGFMNMGRVLRGAHGRARQRLGGLARRALARRVKVNGKPASVTYDRLRSCSAEIRQ